MTKRKLSKSEKGLLLGFATNLLSESVHNHVFNFVEVESGLSRKYFMPPLIEVVGKFSEGNSRVPETNETIDEIILSECENDLADISTLLSWDDDSFFIMFRMKKSSVQVLEELLTSWIAETPDFILDETLLPHQLQILMSISILGNQEPYHQAAHMFNISVADCEACFINICSLFAKNILNYVSWPSAEEADVIANTIEGQYGFPGTVGVIGSASIKSVYSNQISKDSRCILQIVCDNNLIIRDVTVGPSGMNSVNGVFEMSPIFKKLMSKKKPILNAYYHIIGSSEFPQLASLLTPYRSEVLTEDEEQFNILHESVRKSVDKCFNVLVTRFNRLQSIVCTEPEHINIIVLTACVLHNFLILQGDEIECVQT